MRRDVCGFLLLARSADAQMDSDLELVKKEAQDDPAYYVQCTHTRIARILRKAQERGFESEGGDVALL